MIFRFTLHNNFGIVNVGGRELWDHFPGNVDLLLMLLPAQ